MRIRNGAHGYGVVTKLLHWLTVAAVAGQFLVGWTMDVDDGSDRLEAELERVEEEAEARGEAAEERAEEQADRREDAVDDEARSSLLADVVNGNAFADGLSLPEVHVGLGLLVLLLAVVRLLWRRGTPLPPWAEHLSARERRLEAGSEKVLLGLLVGVPATGILLVMAGDDWLPLHVAAQVAFLAAVAVHVGLVLSHTVVRRNRHLARML